MDRARNRRTIASADDAIAHPGPYEPSAAPAAPDRGFAAVSVNDEVPAFDAFF